MRPDVVRGPAGQPGQVGGGGEEAAARGLAVPAAEHRLGLVLQVADEGLAGVAAAVRVVEGAEEVGDRAERRHVARGDALTRAAFGLVPGARGDGDRPGPGLHGPALRGDAHGGRDRGGVAAADPVVGPADQPVAAGDDQPRRGEGDLPQFGVAAGVLAPQAADDVDGLLGGGRELQPGVDRRARVEAEVLGGQPPPQPPGEDLGDQGRGGPSGLLSAQPAGHRGLVVSEVEPVFETELVDAAGQPRMGEPGLRDERG